jgi:hypothetical protein
MDRACLLDLPHRAIAEADWKYEGGRASLSHTRYLLGATSCHISIEYVRRRNSDPQSGQWNAERGCMTRNADCSFGGTRHEDLEHGMGACSFRFSNTTIHAYEDGAGKIVRRELTSETRVRLICQ